MYKKCHLEKSYMKYYIDLIIFKDPINLNFINDSGSTIKFECYNLDIKIENINSLKIFIYNNFS